MPKGRKLLGWSITLISQLWAAAAFAQATPAGTAETTAPAATAKLGEEIVVTGSRIRRKDLTTPAPVAVISREQVLASGKVSIGDFLQSLPEQGNAINTQVNNGGDGSVHVSLRGLGDQRTLVLLNGRRMVGHAFSSMVSDPTPDLNSIPTAAIERIEVLKDGASAVYGSDAIAGVVNIITRKKFDGLEASVMSGISGHGDGNLWDVSVLAGTSGEKGSAMFGVGFFTQKEVFANQRDWSKNPLRYTFSKDANGNVVGKPATYGSSIPPNGAYILPSAADGSGDPLPGQNAAYNAAMAAGGFVTNDTVNGGYRAFKGALEPAGDAYNFQPSNYLTTPSQRISLFSTGDYKVTNNVRAYYEASLVNRQSKIYQAPEPFILSNEGLTISAQNKYNPFGITFDPANDPSGPDVLRRMVEVGPRYSQITDNTFRVVLGFDGTLPDKLGPLAGWFWDIGINYGRSDLGEDTIGNMNTNRLRNALGPTNAAGQCLDAGGAVIAGCVPLNVFGPAGSITPDQVSYVRTHVANKSFYEQTQFFVNTSGELGTLPTADRAVGLAMGYELRRVGGTYVPDALIAMGEITGNKANESGGAYTANEGYAELSIPIASRMPFVDNLELSAAARVFNYSSFGSDWTYKFGGRWSIVPDLALRGTYSTAFRAPSIIDLYAGAADTFNFLTDPCTNPGGPATCNGVVSNQDPNQQLRVKQGGNAKLKPETAKIFTAGVVIQPRWVRNLTITADYYNIGVEQTINTGLGGQFILDQCAAGNTQFCTLVTRNAGGKITQIDDISLNVGETKTDGVDIALRYALPTEYGRFGFLFDGTWLHKYDVTQPDGTVIRGAGTFDAHSQGSYGVYPKWKFNTGINYANAGFTGGLTMRFIGSIQECASPSAPIRLQGTGSYCYVPGAGVNTRNVDAYEIFDLYLGYSFKSSYGRSSIAAGVNNLFDRDPSRIYGGFTAASDPSAYDFMGRFFYVRLTQSI